MKQLEAFQSYFQGMGCFDGLGLPALKTNYQWKIPECPFLKIDRSATLFEQNIELKHLLQKMWCDDAGNRMALSKWVVSKWGGIRANSEPTFSAYLERMKTKEPPTPIKGIASFSKILAASDPTRFAIYDARVAVSINAVQMLFGNPEQPLAFPYLQGRNNVVGHAGKKLGFAHTEEFKQTSLVNAGWIRIPRDNAYHSYMTLLRSVADHLPETKMYLLEMALFANAAKLAEKAIVQSCKLK